ncbi:MAG: aspartate/glutamate racemase family protein [Deltaproteobacteria bacterium]|nr:aspartate/glutamate racemase family protein [Deltaproteobacteria bacterium]
MVTDSGLGGLTTAASMVNALERRASGPGVDVVFVNAQASWNPKAFYGSLPSNEVKGQLFWRVLDKIQEELAPSLLVVACNTLSVVYREMGDTRPFPVVDILAAGNDALQAGWRRYPTAEMVLFATQTTIDGGVYQRGLAAADFPMSRLHTQACPQLSVHIEKGDMLEVARRVSQHVADVASRMHGRKAVLGICCTHYEYVKDVFVKAFAARGITVVTTASPDGEHLIESWTVPDRRLEEGPRVRMRVISQCELTEESIRACAGFLEKTSGTVAEALRQYKHRPNYFPWEDLIA